MEVGLLLSALLFTYAMLRRGRRSRDDYREFPYLGLYSKDKSESPLLYGRHTTNHLYPDREEDDSQDMHRKAG